MSGSGNQSIWLAAGLGLVYLALLLLVIVVLKPSRTLDAERRRPDAPVHTSALTRLTDGARDAIQTRIQPGSGGYLSRAKLDAAGLKKQPADYVLTAGIVVIFAGVMGFMLGGLVFATLLGLIAMASLAVLLRVLTSRRSSKFGEQVPDALQMMSGGMRAGHSLLRAVDATAQESEAPMAEEMSRIVNETRIGRDLGESLDRRRYENEERGLRLDCPSDRNPQGSRRRSGRGPGPRRGNHPRPQPNTTPSSRHSVQKATCLLWCCWRCP